MSSEEAIIAQNRDELYQSSIIKLIQLRNKKKQRYSTKPIYSFFYKKKNTDTSLESLNSLKYRLMRDLYTYTIVNYITVVYNAIIFGGFVTAHISGKEWNDIDIMLNNADIHVLPNFMKNNFVKYLQLIYNFNSNAIKITEIPTNRNSMYANGKYLLCIHEENMKYQIKIDVTLSDEMKGPNSGLLPVTVGKCLMMTNKGIELVQISELIDNHKEWTLQKIIDIIRTGKDVGLCYNNLSSLNDLTRANKEALPEENVKKYSSYFWARIETARELGYTINKFIGQIPPNKDEQINIKTEKILLTAETLIYNTIVSENELRGVNNDRDSDSDSDSGDSYNSYDINSYNL